MRWITPGFVFQIRQDDGSGPCAGPHWTCGTFGGHSRSCGEPNRGDWLIVQRTDGGCGTFTLDVSPA